MSATTVQLTWWGGRRIRWGRSTSVLSKAVCILLLLRSTRGCWPRHFLFGSNTEQGAADYDGLRLLVWRHSGRKEAGVCSYKIVSNGLCVRAHEKEARLPADHPKNLALCGSNRHRLQRSRWREEATRLLGTLPSELREVGEQRTMWPSRLKPWGVLKVTSQLSLSTQTAQPVMVPWMVERLWW